MRRRNFLAAFAVGGRTAAAQNPHLSSGSESPKLKAPAGCTDCHHYFYDPRYPAVSDRVSHPDKATADDYRQLMQRLGIARRSSSGPRGYGTDNRLLLDRGEHVWRPGARHCGCHARYRRRRAQAPRRPRRAWIALQLRAPTSITRAMVAPLGRRIEPLGWHVEVNVGARDLPTMIPLLEDLPTRVVLDHVAHIPEPAGAGDAAFGQVLRLVDKGKTWVKLAAPYAATKVGPPTDADRVRLPALCQSRAGAPHLWHQLAAPGENPKPDDALLFDLQLDWAPDTGVRHRILVENPEALYGFPPIA